MKRARVAWMGAIHDAAEVDGRLQLANGHLVGETDVVWLPPLPPTALPRTIFALDLNHADQNSRARRRTSR